MEIAPPNERKAHSMKVSGKPNVGIAHPKNMMRGIVLKRLMGFITKVMLEK